MGAEHVRTTMVDIESIVLGQYLPFNARGEDMGDLEGLAESILESGLLQPLVVAKGEGGVWHLVAGFRRYAAIMLIREKRPDFMSKVPVVRHQGTDMDAVIANLTENLQREEPDQNAVAKAVQALIDRGWAQSALAKKLGRSPTWVSTQIAYAKGASRSLQKAVDSGKIAPQTAKELSTLPKKEQPKAVKETVERGGTLRDARDVKREKKELPQGSPPEKSPKTLTPSGKTPYKKPSPRVIGQYRDDIEAMLKSTRPGKKRDQMEATLLALNWVLAAGPQPNFYTD